MLPGAALVIVRAAELGLELSPCRCGRVPALSLLNGSEWHLVCSGTCDGVYAAGPELAAVAAEWAAKQVGPDMRCGAPGAL